jgi:hypothetical protein
MATSESNSIPAEVLTAIQEAARYALTGQADAEVLAQIHAQAEQIRSAVLRTHGLLDVAVQAIRELRDGDDE